eukprot:TRINITY_DN4612_c0_g1_i1.p1 TRINITY_DN4612_c0_g1~~TRINITY_DN4612_c0_g1_i1.p1  ORF type:complete len:804 (+),score=187.48 TRINITY_DN4612_c0_g1_i1:71-2482(+)
MTKGEANTKEAWSAPKQKMAYRKSCCVWESYPDFDPAEDFAPTMSDEARQTLENKAAVKPIGMEPVNVPNGFYDAHVTLFDFHQTTEGVAALLEAMDANGVSHAAIHGCSLKKNWSEFEKRKSPDVFNDTDTLYYFSLTDLYLIDALKVLPPATAGRFAPLMCGFKPTDRSLGNHVEALVAGHPEVVWRGIGKLYLRYSEISNLTTGPVPYPGHPAFQVMMGDAGVRNMPVIIQHNACSESAKPYRTGFEYIDELEQCLQKFPEVKVLWVDAGVYVRGQWAGYKDELKRMMSENPNLYISITPEFLRCKRLTDKETVELAEQFNENVMVGSTVTGKFQEKNRYKKDWDAIKRWAGSLTKETYKRVTFSNAFTFFKPRNRRASNFRGDSTHDLTKMMHSGTSSIIRTRSDKLHDVETSKAKDEAPPPEKNKMLEGMRDGVLVHDAEIKHVTIDNHLHMLDFLHKSSGTRKIMQAMDGCGVAKAVMIGMPCVKKWSKDEPEQPLYYQDDNGQCYFYAYSDQMVADAWMALDDNQRKRFAPVMASFNPTDINALSHVERMWDKYPGLWRGLGEIMCRHDDLTALLQEDECPTINHMAMRPIYEFAIDKDLNVMLHHNADRTAEVEDDGEYEYLWEVEQVLKAFPDLKLIWCHAGVSRRTFEPDHWQMIAYMVETYPKLHIDMSWVVWEECVLDPNTGKPSKGWIDTFEAHPTRFSIGSDQVGQFITPAGGNLLRPEIVKYWVLGDMLKPDIAKKILYDNAQEIWFEGWDIPTSDKGGRWKRIAPTMKAETLFHNQGFFDWQNEEMY